MPAARGGALGALDQALERVGAGAHLDHVPLAGLGAAAEGIGQRTLAEGRDQAGLDQGGLARAAVAGDQDQVRGPEPVDQGLRLLAPAEEQGGVLGLERLQAHEGLRHQPDGLGGVEAGGDADEVGEAVAVLGQAHALILLREGRQVGEVARVVGDDRDEGVGAALALLGDHPVERHPHLEPDPVARTLAGQQQAEGGGVRWRSPPRAGPARACRRAADAGRRAACRPRPSARRPAPRGSPRSPPRASPPARCRPPHATGTIGAPCAEYLSPRRGCAAPAPRASPVPTASQCRPQEPARPRFAGAPGSPRPLVHHPPICPKMVTNPLASPRHSRKSSRIKYLSVLSCA